MKKDKIILYDANETNFTHNGIRVLRPIECYINRDLTEYGYDLDMVYPIDDRDYWKDITEDRIIKANGQLFRIVHIDKSVIDNTVTVYAKHIFFDLQKNFIEGTNVVSKNGIMALGQLLNATAYEHNFTGYSDIAKLNNLNCTRKNVLDALIGDNNSFVNRWGSEFDVDNFNLKFLNQVGEDKGYKIKYGKNLTGLVVKTDFTEIVTRIRPIGFDGIELPDGAKYVDSANINNYSMPIIKEIKYENVKWTGSLNYEEIEGDESLIFDDLSLAQAELRRLAMLEFTDEEIDLPKVTCEINFVDLSTTEEYSQFKNLTTVSLGDIVTIEHLPLGINMKARCISYKYNCLKEEYEEIVIGHYVKNFFTETTNKNNKLDNVDTNISEEIQSVYVQAIKKMTEMMNKGLNGYVVVTNNEILIMDTDDKTTAKNVWRFNSAGIAFSSDGYDGEFIVGMTMDGHINGALITGASIKGDMIEAGAITTRELAVEIQNTIKTAMTEETTQAMITANLNQFESNLSQTFITQENATKQIQDATEIAVEQATQGIVGSAVEQAMNSVNDQLDGKLSEYTTNTLNPYLQDAMAEVLDSSKEYVVEVTANFYTKEETDSKISQTREEIEIGISTTYETKEESSIKIGEAVEGITVGAINRVFGTAQEKTYEFTGIVNDSWIAYDISSDISDKDVIVSFEYDLNATLQNGSTLKFQSQYMSVSNSITYLPNYDIITSNKIQTVNLKNQQVTFVTRWDGLQQDAKFRFRADGITGTFTIRKAQIKVGNKITEWSVAPEDIESNANNYTIQQLTNYYTKEQTNSLISVTKDEINLGVLSTYETKANVQNIVSKSIETSANNASNIVNSVIQNYYTKEETDSAIKIAKDEINLGVSTIYETKESVENSVQDMNNKLSNLKIGGTNLLLGTSEPRIIKGTNSQNQYASLYEIVDNDKHFCLLADTEVVLSFDYEFGEGVVGYFKVQTNGVYQSSLGEKSEHIIDLSDTIYGTSSTVTHPIVDEKGNMLVDENGNIICSAESSKGHATKVITLTNSDTAGFTGVRLHLNNCNGIVKISNMKLEKGNSATTWSPAPQDMLDGLVTDDTFNQTISNYYTKTETDSRIRVAKDEINLGVSSNYYTKTEMNNTINTINSTIETIKENVAEIVITEDMITSAVGNKFYTKEQVENAILEKDYATSSQVTQTVNNLKIEFGESGGYNLFENSKFHLGLGQWQIHSYNNPAGSFEVFSSNYQWAYPDTEVNTFIATLPVGKSGVEYGLRQNVKTTIGKTYTVSFYYAGHRCSTGMIIVRKSDSSWLTNKTFNPSAYGGGNGSSLNSWGRVSVTFTAVETSTRIEFCLCDCTGSSPSKLFIVKPQCEEGTVTSAWSPNSDEIRTGITTISKDGISVTHSNVDTYTNMSASGFTITQSSTGKQLFNATNGNLTMEGILSTGSSGNRIIVSDSNYKVYNGSVQKAFFGLRNNDSYISPMLHMSADAIGTTAYDNFSINMYKRNNNPSSSTTDYMDMAYYCSSYNDYSNMKMYGNGTMRIAPVSSLEISTNYNNGTYNNPSGYEYVIANFASSSNQYFNARLQINGVVNNGNGQGLVLGDYRSESAQAYVCIYANGSDGTRAFRPVTGQSGGVYNGTSNAMWRAVYSSNGTIQTSDSRYKAITDDTNLEDCFNMIKNTKIYNYVMLDKNKEKMSEIEYIENALTNVVNETDIQMGVMAQDLLKYESGKQIVVHENIKDNETGEIIDDIYSVNAYPFATAVAGALQFEIAKREKLERLVKELQQKVDELEKK